MGVIMQEGAPRLRRRAYAPLSHVFLDGALGDVEAQLEQLATNAFRAPQAIVQPHRFGESHGLGNYSGFP